MSCQTARRRAPCVVFVDELDAVGARRDDNTASSAPSSALAQLLTELDGFQVIPPAPPARLSAQFVVLWINPGPSAG